MSKIKIHESLRFDLIEEYRWLVLEWLDKMNKSARKPIRANQSADVAMEAIETMFNDLELANKDIQKRLAKKIFRLVEVRHPELQKRRGELERIRETEKRFRYALEVVEEFIATEGYGKSEDVKKLRAQLKNIVDEGERDNTENIFRHFRNNQPRSRYKEMMAEIVEVILEEHNRCAIKIKKSAIIQSLTTCIDAIFLEGIRESSDWTSMGAAIRAGRKRKSTT